LLNLRGPTDTLNTEQEKKYLASLLSKLHVSPASTESLLRSLYDEVSLAVENKKIALDATGRNALYKIHVSLGKIVNSMNEKEKDSQGLVVRGGRKSGVVPSIEVEDASGDGEDEKTVIEKSEEGDEDEETVIAGECGRRSQTRDSLVEELLSDGDADGDGEDVGISRM